MSDNIPLKAALKEKEKIPVIEYTNNVSLRVDVSICVPVYQQVEWIKQCLDSILSQDTSLVIEILIGEDGSTDGTREICVEYAERYSETIRLFLNARENNISVNGKASGNFNLLFLAMQARGRFLAFCEGDDHWLDNRKIEKQISALNTHEGCRVCFHSAFSGNPRELSCNTLIAHHGDNMSVFSASQVILSGGAFCPTASLIIRRDVLNDLPTWLINSPVIDYFMQVIATIPSGALYLPDSMCFYNTAHSASWSNTIRKDRNYSDSFYSSYFTFLDLLANHVGSKYKDDLDEYLLNQKFSSVFGTLCSHEFKVVTYDDIKHRVHFRSKIKWLLYRCSVLLDFNKF